jgi:hypothetical protein
MEEDVGLEALFVPIAVTVHSHEAQRAGKN